MDGRDAMHASQSKEKTLWQNKQKTETTQDNLLQTNNLDMQKEAELQQDAAKTRTIEITIMMMRQETVGMHLMINIQIMSFTKKLAEKVAKESQTSAALNITERSAIEAVKPQLHLTTTNFIKTLVEKVAKKSHTKEAPNITERSVIEGAKPLLHLTATSFIKTLAEKAVKKSPMREALNITERSDIEAVKRPLRLTATSFTKTLVEEVVKKSPTSGAPNTTEKLDIGVAASGASTANTTTNIIATKSKLFYNTSWASSPSLFLLDFFRNKGFVEQLREHGVETG